MVSIEAWYLGGDDEPLTIKTVADVEALANRVRAESSEHTVPALIQFEARTESGWAILQAGFRGMVGLLAYTDPKGSYMTRRDDVSPTYTVNYDYMGHLREVAADAEVEDHLVLDGIKEFVYNGGQKPTVTATKVEARSH